MGRLKFGPGSPTAEPPRIKDKGLWGTLAEMSNGKKNPPKFFLRQGRTIVFPPHPPGITTVMLQWGFSMRSLRNGDSGGVREKHDSTALPLEEFGVFCSI